MAISENNRFAVKGVIQSLKEVGYGSEGKTRLEVRVTTEGFMRENEPPEQVDVVFSLFSGRARDAAVEAGEGALVGVTGYLQSRDGRNGGTFADFRVVTLRAVDGPTKPRPAPEPPSHTDDIPF